MIPEDKIKLYRIYKIYGYKFILTVNTCTGYSGQDFSLSDPESGDSQPLIKTDQI
jgi:hypothetical protein